MLHEHYDAARNLSTGNRGKAGGARLRLPFSAKDSGKFALRVLVPKGSQLMQERICSSNRFCFLITKLKSSAQRPSSKENSEEEQQESSGVCSYRFWERKPPGCDLFQMLFPFNPFFRRKRETQPITSKPFGEIEESRRGQSFTAAYDVLQIKRDKRDLRSSCPLRSVR
jgi:hypothetical protein